MSHTRYLDLPPSLHLLSNWGVIAAALVLFGVDFFVDKIPAFDLVWNALHTFIRVPVAALLACQATAVSHARRAARRHSCRRRHRLHRSRRQNRRSRRGHSLARALLQHRAQPRRRFLAVFLTWLSTWKPYIAAAIAFVCILVTLILIRFVFRALVSLRHRRKRAVPA